MYNLFINVAPITFVCGIAGFLGYLVNTKKNESAEKKETIIDTARNAIAGAIMGSVVFMLLRDLTELQLGASCAISIAISFFGEERSLELLERLISLRFGSFRGKRDG